MDSLERLRPRLACDTRLHLRYETFNLDAEAEVAAWIDARRIALLAFNDHTAAMAAKADDPKALAKYADRANMAVDAFRLLLHRVHARHVEVPSGIERLATLANDAGIPLASHDDETPAMRAWFHARGCAISEFPKTGPTARAAREFGNDVVMGAPNVVRGGSHLSAVSASSLIQDRLCTILTSDYYYPALLHAAFRLDRDGILPLTDAWRLISANPAAAAGLHDRGEVTPGHRADFILVDDSDPMLPRVAATFVAGRPVFLDDRLARAA
jgi:alpha-D-ribose 1-methylphosphonate 5-triphosphate diphosphatase